MPDLQIHPDIPLYIKVHVISQSMVPHLLQGIGLIQVDVYVLSLHQPSEH